MRLREIDADRTGAMGGSFGHRSTPPKSCVSGPVIYTAALPAREFTVSFVASLLEAERHRRGILPGPPCAGLPPPRGAGAALDLPPHSCWPSSRATIRSLSTVYRYLHKAIIALAAAAPEMHATLLAADWPATRM